MKTKYDELTLTHNISGFILLSEHYEKFYKKELFNPSRYRIIQ